MIEKLKEIKNKLEKQMKLLKHSHNPSVMNKYSILIEDALAIDRVISILNVDTKKRTNELPCLCERVILTQEEKEFAPRCMEYGEYPR